MGGYWLVFEETERSIVNAPSNVPEVSRSLGRATSRKFEPLPDETHQIDDLIQTIKEAVDKFAADRSSRGDLKIVSRALRELRYAFKVFAPYRAIRKVSIFGSARTQPDEPAYQQAMALGRAMAELDWLVVTGAASGIMEAGHRGAGREKSMGLNILLPFEQAANPVIAGDPKLVHMKYFFTRKLMFVKECDAVVCLPGGFGTLDEALEVLTLLQTGKRDMVPLVLLDAPGGRYWQALDTFFREHVLARGMISPEDRYLYRITDRYEEAVAEIVGFYRVYHSMRYVREKLVFRLTTTISPGLLDAINREFADILVDGRFELTGPLPAEMDEPELSHLPRLVFSFDRHSMGKLRRLIDSLNAGEVSPVD
ncbi:MAG: Rossman fold protein, TIGR00730 family [Pirellulaceae bacterium]|nr:MAG: Rossman fold protein, TIGR00730 family [Pirellulaceae bacterium]